MPNNQRDQKVMSSAKKASRESNPLMTRWTSRPVPDKRARARINQRRHRDRIKNHIACLESDLAKSRRDLTVALLTIKTLATELERLRPISHQIRGRCSATSSKLDSELAVATAQMVPSPCPESEQNAAPSNLLSLAEVFPHTTNDKKGLRDDTELGYRGSPLLSTLPMCDLVPRLSTTMETEEANCLQLPPPPRGESTTRCRDAYELIQAQNHAGLEDFVIISQLTPGFRGPTAEGDGCRVENRTLFALLDQALA